MQFSLVPKLKVTDDVARRIIRAKGGMKDFPEEEFGRYVGVLAGIEPDSIQMREQVGAVFQVMTGHDDP